MEQSDLWLNPAVLDWDARIEGTIVDERVLPDPSWRFWGHAERLLDDKQNELIRADAIVTLRRCVRHRLDSLLDIYSLGRIQLEKKLKYKAEILEHFGIIRPFMLKQLIMFRDSIEHESEPPPEYPQCRAFVDVIWYFLKSTDRLVREVIETILLQRVDQGSRTDNYWLQLEFADDHGLDWTPHVRGWLYPAVVSTSLCSGHVHVQDTNYKTRSEMKRDWTALEAGEAGRGINDEDIYFSGRILGPPQAVRRIVTRYFDVVGFSTV